MTVLRIGLGHHYQAYCHVIETDYPARWNRLQAAEVSRRLKQLDWLLIEIQRRQLDVGGGVLTLSDPRTWELTDEMFLFTEAFYYFAWRTREAIRALPFLKSFNPIGVLKVRNKLIQHPDEKDGFFSMGMQSDDDRGPILDSGADSARAWHDPGLYANAEEFRDKLFRVLTPFFKRDMALRRAELKARVGKGDASKTNGHS